VTGALVRVTEGGDQEEREEDREDEKDFSHGVAIVSKIQLSFTAAAARIVLLGGRSKAPFLFFPGETVWHSFCH
jgi:hypothetical protein